MSSEMECLRRDGNRFLIEATASVVEWEGAPATRVFLLDISERRRRETAEREAENLRSVTMLANATAHEINNPLTVVAGSIHFLGAEIKARPTVQVHLERAKQGVQRITEMIGHMQSITRLERLQELDTEGLPTLDLRRSSGSAPARREPMERSCSSMMSPTSAPSHGTCSRPRGTGSWKPATRRRHCGLRRSTASRSTCYRPMS
jgi:signal transduction histidine kinase